MELKKMFCDEIPPAIRKQAEITLGETKENKTQRLKELRELLNAESDLLPCMEDLFLLRFLRQKKFEVKRAFESIKKYYAFKAKYSGSMTDLKPSDVKHILDQCFTAVLEHTDREGAGVFVIRHANLDMRRFSADEIISCIPVLAEMSLQSEMPQLVGYSLILDYEDFSINSLRHFAAPSILYRLITSVLDYVPCRVKAVHIVNESFFTHLFYAAAKKMAPEKLVKRLHFHGKNYSSLHEYVPKEILPSELGGKQGSITEIARKCNERIFSIEDHIIKMNMYGYQGKTLQKLKNCYQ